MAKAKKKSSRSPLQMARTINGLEAQLSHVQEDLDRVRQYNAQLVSTKLEDTNKLSKFDQINKELHAKIEHYRKHAEELVQLNGALRNEINMNQRAMEQSTETLDRASAEFTRVTGEITGLERAIAIMSGVRATN